MPMTNKEFRQWTEAKIAGTHHQNGAIFIEFDVLVPDLKISGDIRKERVTAMIELSEMK